MATGVWLLHLLEMTNMTATLALRCINTAIVQAKTRTETLKHAFGSVFRDKSVYKFFIHIS